MKNNIIITFLSEQNLSGVDDRATQTAKGNLQVLEGGRYIIEYTEPDEEMDKIVSTLHIESPNKVILSRRGQYETVFTIEQGVIHRTIYKTPFIEVPMEIKGNAVSTRFTEKGGSIHLLYTLTCGGQPLSENRLIMNFTITD